MTARATITAAAMRQAREAAKQDGLRVTIRAGDTVIILDPVSTPRDDAADLDLVSMRKR